MDGGSLDLPLRRTDGDVKAERPDGVGGPGGDHSRGPCQIHMSAETCDKDGGMDNGAAVHDTRDGTGCAGIAR